MVDDSIGTRWPLHTYEFKNDSTFLQRDILTEKGRITLKGKWWLSNDTLVTESYLPQTNQAYIFKMVIRFYHSGLFYELINQFPGSFMFTVFRRLDDGRSESDVKGPILSLLSL